MADCQELLNRAGKAFDAGNDDEACQLAEEALRSNPHSGMGHQILGMTLVRRNQPYQAIDTLTHALALQPDLVPARCQLGVAHSMLGEGDQALACFETAIRLMPEHVASRFNRAQMWLQQGRFRDGWLEYEWRWQTGEVPRPNVPRPRWDGRPLQGRSILVHTEQGMGDTLQFIRLLAHVKRQGARVVLACQKQLHRLLKCLPWVDEWFPIDEEAPITFEWTTPLLSLPGLLHVDCEADVPDEGAYVVAEPERVERWRPRIESLAGLKVGLNWQGKPEQTRDPLRSVALEKLAPIAQVEGVSLVSLHKGAGEPQIEMNRARVPLTILDDLDADGAFVDTAAVMSLLDLIISVDTSTVHLAGAMRRPVWLPLSTACDWRWGRHRTDSPWYPTMRLFRQQTFNTWEPVFDEMARALRELRDQPLSVRSSNATGVELPHCPIAVGELIDKITILEIKSERIRNPDKLANVRRELQLLREVQRTSAAMRPEIAELTAELKSVNERIWEVEDEIRLCEKESDFGERFIKLARTVYKTNDRRSELKRRLNELSGSALLEEKSHSGS